MERGVDLVVMCDAGFDGGSRMALTRAAIIPTKSGIIDPKMKRGSSRSRAARYAWPKKFNEGARLREQPTSKYHREHHRLRRDGEHARAGER